jgi:DNA-binding NarL/FixJ family response regulator
VAIDGGEGAGLLGAERPAMLEAALLAAIRLVAAPVFLVDGALRVLHSNEAGKHLLKLDPEQTKAALARSVSGRTEPQRTSALSPVRGVHHWLVSLPLEGPAVDAAAAALRVEYQLTKRQAEVMSLVAQGHANRDIADRLGCSLRTVEIHLSAVFRKTGQDSRTKLVMWFYRR